MARVLSTHCCRTLALSSTAALALLLLTGCHPASPSVASEVQNVSTEPPVIAVSTARLEIWEQTVHVHGTFLPEESAILGTKVPGRMAQMLVDIGTVVDAATPVAQLDRTQLDLELRHAQALHAQACAILGLKPEDSPTKLVPDQAPNVRQEKALLDQAELDLDRARALREQGAISAEELDAREATQKVAQARYAASLNAVDERIAQLEVRRAEVAQAKQNAEDSVILAPFQGIVQQRFTAPGSYLSAGDAVITLVRCDKLRFQGAVPEKQAHLVHTGQEIQIRVRNEDQTRKATINRLTPVIDLKSRALVFQADVANPQLELRPGLFAEADITVDTAAQSVVLPLSAVVEFAGLEKVWKVINGETVETIVETGPRRNQRIVILSGVQPGDIVVTDGKQAPTGKVQIQPQPPPAT